MYELLIKSSTPEEFKEGIKGLYRLFPDAPNATSKPGGVQTDAITSTTHVTKPENKVTPAAQEKPAATATPVVKETPATGERPTIEAMRIAVTEFQAKDGNREILKALFAKYNAKGVSSLDAAQYAEFLNELKAK